MPRLVLASASASRRALLTAAGLHFGVCPADIDEAAVKRTAQSEGWTPQTAALRLAGLKAETIGRVQPDALIIGSDQILVCDERWFDKPGTKPGLRTQLEQLAGRQHCLVTAVVCSVGDEVVWEHVEQPLLTMRALSQAFLDAYVEQEGDAVAGCVGGYRLEGPGIQLFEAVIGDHSAILGLPLLPLLGFLRRHGVLAA
ncbi:MAG: Maf family protein [Acetobacteraceae bacterium]|nr:Maf family protein [Acetobacteraceae bacterium]